MGLLPGEEGYSRGTADGRGTVMALVKGALVEEVLLGQGHVVERVHVQVLVIGEDEDDIGLFLFGIQPRIPEGFLVVVISVGNGQSQMKTEEHIGGAHLVSDAGDGP